MRERVSQQRQREEKKRNKKSKKAIPHFCVKKGFLLVKMKLKPETEFLSWGSGMSTLLYSIVHLSALV